MGEELALHIAQEADDLAYVVLSADDDAVNLFVDGGNEDSGLLLESRKTAESVWLKRHDVAEIRDWLTDWLSTQERGE